MNETPRSSFIPRQTSTAVPARMQRRRTFHVFGFLTAVALIASLLAAGGSYFYIGILEKERDAARTELAAEVAKSSTDKMNELRDFNRQVLAVKYMLDQHVAPSKLFRVLEFSTMERVQFTDFGFEYNPGADILLSLGGGTKEFKTVAHQLLQFGNEPLLKDGDVDEVGSSLVSPEDAGKAGNTEEHDVNFKIAAKLDLNAMQYEAQLPSEPVSTSEGVGDTVLSSGEVLGETTTTQEKEQSVQSVE